MAAAGLVTLVQRWLFVPTNLFVGNVGQVFFSDLARARYEAPELMPSLFARRVRHLTLTAVAVVACLAIVVPPSIGLAFGARWEIAGQYFLLLCTFLGATIASSPFGCAVDVLQRQDLHLLRDLLRAAVLGAALIIAKLLNASVEGSLALVSAAGVLNAVTYLFISWLAIHQHRVPASDSATGPSLNDLVADVLV
jgi:O-antigen/teichoic acid export membrane protein